MRRPWFARQQPRWRRKPERAWVSGFLSIALHGLILLLFRLSWPAEQPPERRIELALVKAGDPATSDLVMPTPDVAPPPQGRPRRRAASSAPKEAPGGEHALAPEVGPEVDLDPQPMVPTSFKEWRAGTAHLPRGGSLGNAAVDTFGRDRCTPPNPRPVERVYLLFDSSGSMSEVRRSQALACASQYARASLASGASVVVGNFARGTTVSPPTRSMFDVEIALRAASDVTATILPSRELQQFWDAAPVASDLVIISDGWFATPDDTLLWYRYFLEVNADNRGVMYTVGVPGHRYAVGKLREIGFHVFMYETIGRGGADR